MGNPEIGSRKEPISTTEDERRAKPLDSRVESLATLLAKDYAEKNYAKREDGTFEPAWRGVNGEGIYKNKSPEELIHIRDISYDELARELDAKKIDSSTIDLKKTLEGKTDDEIRALVIDIANQPYDEYSEYWKKQNRNGAEFMIKLIDERGADVIASLDLQDKKTRDEYGDLIHNDWVRHNERIRNLNYGGIALAKQFVELPAEEQQKDIDQIRVTQEWLKKQNQPKANSSWESLGDFIRTIAEAGISPEQGAIRSLVERRKDYEKFMSDFQAAVDAGIANEDLERNSHEIQNIRRFFFEKIESKSPLSIQEIATVLYALKDRGDNEGVIRVFEAGRDFGSDKSATLKEFYAVSLNKVGRLEECIQVLDELTYDDNARTGEVAGILGKVYKLQSERATDLAEKTAYMQKSVDTLRKGFYQTYEYYPGINLVYNQIELANMKDVPNLITKAFDDAELVVYAAKKAGAENTSDYWATATLLEASVLAGEVTPQTIEKCLAASKHDWELESTLNNLHRVAEAISKQLQSANMDETTAKRLSQVRELIVGNDEQVGIIQQLENGKTTEKAEEDHDSKDDILKNGFMYGETTTLIGGNIKFGGQLQDHIVNRFDVKTAYAIIEFFGLDQVNNVNDFNDAIDPIIRNQFNTANLEDLHSPEHKVYDSQIKNLLKITGVNDLDRANVDTRTNVMMDFLLGKGDCRQHAYAKQLLFDSWKTFRLNNLIGSLRNAQENTDSTEGDRIKGKIDELLNKQLFVFDSIISSKVKMNSLYNPQFQDGKYIESDHYENIEGHTWNGLVTFGKDGHVVSLEMADSFYQDEYGLGGKHQVLTNIEDYMEDGLVVTTIQALNQETGQMEDVPVRLRPTIYAGNRSTRSITKHADDGAAYIRGINLGYYVNSVIETISSPQVIDFWRAVAS